MRSYPAEPDEWHEMLIAYLGPQELVGFIPDFFCPTPRPPFSVTPPDEHVPLLTSIRTAPEVWTNFEGDKSIELAQCGYCARIIGRQHILLNNRQKWASAMYFIKEMP